MNLPEISIKRPVTVLMLMLIVILFGVVSLSKLPVELYPNTSFGEISIIIQARGGIPPTEVEALVTKPVEDAVATVSNLQQLLSISKEGESTVVMSFKPGTNMDYAALEVREKFAKIKNQLPKDIEKPVIAQFQQSDVPAVIIAVTSEQRTTEDIRKLVDQGIKEAFRRVPGVANVEVAGGRERKILVEADQTRLAAYGIPIDEVTSTLGANNMNFLSGEVERTNDRYLIRVQGEFESIDQIKNMALRRTPEGSVIRVKDVATVKDSYLEPREYSRLDVRPVVTIYIQKESTKNTISVVDEVLKEQKNIQANLPRDIQLVVTSNQAVSIRSAIKGLQESLLQGIILIILVFFIFLFRLKFWSFLAVLVLIVTTLFTKGIPLYFLFLGLITSLVVVKRFRSIIIVTLPIPVAVIGTFAYMNTVGLTINVMTLFGLALGVGMLVDNSIVVFENILKKRENGGEIIMAASTGSSEMFIAIIASTITTVIVFLPLVFVGAELQRLYSGMAATVVSSMLISLVCAVTMVPMMCARKSFSSSMNVEKKNKEDKSSWEKNFSKREREFLFFTIRHRRRVLYACIGLLCVSMFFLTRLGTEYLGSTEQKKFTVFVELPTGAKLEASDTVVKKVETFIRALPEVVTVTSRIEPWSSKIYVELQDPTKRRRTTDDVIDAIRAETNKMQPAFIYFQKEEQVGTKEVILEVFGHNYEKLRELAIAIANRMESVKGLSDTKIRMREGRPEMQLLVDKKEVGLHGLTVQDSGNQVHGQMRGFRATVFHTEGREVETISRLDEKYRKTFKDLHNLILTNRRGDSVLLDQVTGFKFGLGPSEIWRKNKNRMIQVSSNIGKIPLSKVVEQLKKGLKDIPFPEDYSYKIGGDYPTLVETNKQMRIMILAVLVLIYLVLASIFESFYQPILIMVAVPLALVGAVIALYLGPRSIGVGAMLGMMMLGGIVVNHSIMLIDRINHYVRNKGISPVRAAVLANTDRLRPILMTVTSTVLGLVPMAFDRSESANLWSPLAKTVIGGLLGSTFLTLVVTPAFYILFNDIIHFIKGGKPWFFIKKFVIKDIPRWFQSIVEKPNLEKKD